MSLKVLAFLSFAAFTNFPTVFTQNQRIIRPGPVIQTTSGPVQGLQELYDRTKLINTFKGIRYASPPIGNLRFREAVEPEPWTQIFQAWNYGPRCAQIDEFSLEYSGEEDCLFLNVATPVPIRRRLPVVVYIHGGGLHGGNGEFKGPEYIIEENVIYVSPNYRVNVLGFLNSGDKTSPGNYGIKDMITVLRWVRHNIAAFGGDPDNVTIMGFSGGSVGVHALVVSNAAAGLFHRALSHSGSLFNNWAFNRNPSKTVDTIIETLGMDSNTTEDFVQQLREVSVEKLVTTLMMNELERLKTYFEELSFVTSVDPVDSEEAIIFSAPVEDLVRSGNINRVPFIIGFNSGESLYAINEVNEDPTVLDAYNENPNLLVPSEWNLTHDSPEALEVIDEFKRVYFLGVENITTGLAWQWSGYVGDRQLVFGASKQAQLHSAVQTVFYFKFSFSGALSFGQIQQSLMQYSGAIHGDDSNYLYHFDQYPLPVPIVDHALMVRLRFVRLWTNFFKYNHPTPFRLDPILRTVWPASTAKVEFLEIGSTLSAEVHPFKDRMDMWHEFDRRFNP